MNNTLLFGGYIGERLAPPPLQCNAAIHFTFTFLSLSPTRKHTHLNQITFMLVISVATISQRVMKIEKERYCVCVYV